MAFGKKRRQADGEVFRRSRYEDGGRRGRYEEDGDTIYEVRQVREKPLPRQDAGYGVGDSYRRQEEYGRPENSRYVRQSYEYEPSGREDDELYGRRQQETLRRRQPEREARWARDPYDDRYQGSYDAFDEFAESPERGYARQERGGYHQDGFEREETGKPVRKSRPAYDGYARKSRRKPERRNNRKSSFVVKLILLLIASALLFLFYRFSRMDRVHLRNMLKNDGALVGDGYENFVIYGVDSREGKLTKDAHSDTIVICSINRKDKSAKLVSVYRDTYLDNTNGEYRKATECYFFGGPERSINMLNKNLDLDLQDYIAVDFNAVIKAVDLIGGVDINVTEDELPYINGYQTENSQVTGAQITPVESAGYQHLNGIQALAYCRIRYTAGNDFKRTERQRDVLTQIFEKAREQGKTQMLKVVDTLMPYISTSFSNAEIVSLVSEMGDVTITDQTGFPFEQQAADIAAGDCVVPVNLANNVSQLHAFLFGQTDYTPSQTVQEISQQIMNDTGIA